MLTALNIKNFFNTGAAVNIQPKLNHKDERTDTAE